MSEIEVTTFPVAPLGCNCSIVQCKTTNDAVVIDPGGEAERIIEMLQKKGCRVRWIIHTHAHLDHIMGTHGVAEFCKSASSESVSPLKVALHEGDMFLYNGLAAQCRMFGLPLTDAKTAINHHLLDEEPLEFGNSKIKVLHTPGHTPGSCSFVILEAGLVFSGDTLFAGGIGRTDLPGGNTELIFQSIRGRLFTLDDGTKVIPGHGEFTRIYDEKKYNPFFG